jgi:predicted membrane-bound mannosyltransferase
MYTIESMKKESRRLYILLIILTIGAFFRFWKLDSIPPSLFYDEAINGNYAISVMEFGNFKVLYSDCREGLFINLLVLSFKIFGPSIWSLKFIPALFGIFTILGLYFLTKELFNYRVALFASFLLSCSFWHVNFSRIAFRGFLTPFVLVYLFLFLFKGFNNLKVRNKSLLYCGLGCMFFWLRISYLCCF